MTSRRSDAPSTFKTALIHGGIGLLVGGMVVGGSASAIQLAGNPQDAGPRVQLAVFDVPATIGDPGLKDRIPDRDLTEIRMASLQPLYEERTGEPTLDVDYPSYEGPLAEGSGEARFIAASAEAEPRRGVRINGRVVYPGEALSDVETLSELPPAPIDGLHERTSRGRLPVVAGDGREVADAYARPFHARADQPTVSIVLGGLGINYTHTIAAIDDLPPEVTLSFAAHARGLQTWIDRARAAGHEVLIELPLEPYDHGRVRPHQNMLRADASGADNVDNLEGILALGQGYFGLLNYQGDRFASNDDAAQTMFAALRDRGVAFIEDGSIPGEGLSQAAALSGARFAKADIVVDSRIDAESMQSQLMALEARALQDGSALGTAIAYPLTIDILSEWVEELEDKGIMLAPASTLQAVPEPAHRVETSLSGAPEISVNLP